MTNKRPPILNVLIVEDNHFFRESMRRELGLFPEFVLVIGAADNVADARELVRTNALDVVLLDLMVKQFPGDPEPKALYGLAAIREFRHLAADARVLVISQFSGRYAEIVVSALELGAHGYIAKDDDFDGESIVRMIRGAARGEPVFTPQIALVLLRHEIADHLDAKERRVLEGMANGYSLEEIAETHVVAISDVVAQVKSVLNRIHEVGRHQDAARVVERYSDLL